MKFEIEITDDKEIADIFKKISDEEICKIQQICERYGEEEDDVNLVTASYETINKSIFGDSAKPLGGSGGNNQSGVAEYLKSLAESNERLAKARAAAAAQYK